MKKTKNKIILILATCLKEDHDITSIGVTQEDKSYICELFENTPKIDNSIGVLINNYLINNKKDLSKIKDKDLTYDKMIITFKKQKVHILDNIPSKYTYKTLRSVVSNYLEYFELMLKNDILKTDNEFAVCIVPVLLNKELYDLSQKMMNDYQKRDDKSQDYYKFTEFFNSNKKDFFYTIYLTQNHKL